ncbi:acyl-coenzyme A thioesterase 1-like [Conger conger]|uniref:acyl-coenzyme A thioesterase 1-like n=1 Tax=Conger conger TaxID=82655 RepID=UPI002A5AF07A|nr:acyl-coenzyme A thioesterase 1-like [Conger conger]
MHVFSIINTRSVRLFRHIFFKGFSRTSTNMSSGVRLRLLPRSKCLFNETIHTTIEGLVPGKCVELTAKLTDDKGVTFKSSGTYKADPRGEIRLDSHPSLGGSYSGVEPMGLFWSMRPEMPHVKLRKRDALSPCLVHIEVHDSERQGHVLARETNARGFMVEGLRRIPIKEGRIRGILFLPPGPGPFPGIVHMHTLGGGLSEVSGSLLANQGFVVLSLAFYGYEDLPKNMTKLDLEYFEEAIMFLRNLPEVKAPGVGILSISKSGDLALSMASFLTGVSATVCVNGCNANVLAPLHYRGMVIPPLLANLNRAMATESGVLDVSNCLLDPMAPENQGSLIPIERAKCTFLFAVSGDDRNWKSCFYAEQMMKRLKDHGKHDSELVVYPKAGHFLEVPYMPHCATGMHAAVGNAVVAFGGDPSAHAEAQVDLWNRIPEFFWKHLDSKNEPKVHTLAIS